MKLVREEELRRKREYMKGYYTRTRDVLVAKSRAYYAENRARILAQDKIDRAVNRDQYRAAMARYRKQEPHRCFLYAAKRNAKRKGIPFALTVADVQLPTHCPVFGIELQYGGGQGKRGPSSASLDRIDNAKGYVPGNVMVVSWRANALKRDASIAELRMLADFYENAAKNGQ